MRSPRVSGINLAVLYGTSLKSLASISEGIFRQDFDACLVIISVAMASLSDQSIVVGGGLARMSAANTVLENCGSVVLDKSIFCGGKSTKAPPESMALTREHRAIRESKTQQICSRLTL